MDTFYWINSWQEVPLIGFALVPLKLVNTFFRFNNMESGIKFTGWWNLANKKISLHFWSMATIYQMNPGQED